MNADELTVLRQEALSTDWEKAKTACARLCEMPNDEALNVLIDLLEQPTPRTRNLAALALRERADSRAVAPLLMAIRNPGNHSYNGTMVYALQTLDCRHHLKDLFEILFYESYEAKLMAMTVLEEQEFEFTVDDLTSIKHQWDNCKAHPTLCHGFDENHENIEYFVDGFMSYLEE
ncbi:HEAT repeat domain-containing protein [Hymenobacter sediminis]|uniref:HEAT repeat domain-containing protein n=1 Tax=Hymenobacter sediminis TaxID=2218621 RepID=UPI000DA69FAE|nr:HEAT repeat domain-containing protein [Hymenobacter sediminis]RPD47603.1 HEAT repeat domain-containing protein [Hymenobacter sediminis]